MPQLSITGIKCSWFCHQLTIGNRVAYITSIGQREYPLKKFIVIWLLWKKHFVKNMNYFLLLFIYMGFYDHNIYTTNMLHCLIGQEWVDYLICPRFFLVMLNPISTSLIPLSIAMLTRGINIIQYFQLRCMKSYNLRIKVDQLYNISDNTSMLCFSQCEVVRWINK